MNILRLWIAVYCAAGAVLLAGPPALGNTAPHHPEPCSCEAPYDSCNAGPPVTLTRGQPSTLDLCLDLQPTGLQASSGGTIVCSTGNPGDGNEICAWQLEIHADSGMAISDFAPAGEFAAHIEASQVLRLNQISGATGGQWGTVHLGTLTLAIDENCSGCQLAVNGLYSEAYDAALDLHSMSPEVIAVPEPGGPLLLTAQFLLLQYLHRRRKRAEHAKSAACLGTLLCLSFYVGATFFFADSARAGIVTPIGTTHNSDLGTPTKSGLGMAMTRLGDLDGDGVEDLVLGLPELAPNKEGGVMIVFPYRDGSIKSTQLINSSTGDLSGSLGTFAFFGSAVAALGDLDSDGVEDIAVGAPGADEVWILFLDSDGTVKSEQVIAAGGASGSEAGAAIAVLGDIDNDSVVDLAVGAPSADCSALAHDCGEVAITFLNTNGTRKAVSYLNSGSISGLVAGSRFGSALAPLGDFDGNGVPDFVAGVPGAAPSRAGDVLFVRLDTVGEALSAQPLVNGPYFFPFALTASAEFGSSITVLGDLDGNSVPDIAVGAPGMLDSVPNLNAGAVSLVLLRKQALELKVKQAEQLDDSSAGVPNAFGLETFFGSGLAMVDVDGDGSDELWAGAVQDAGETESGLYWKFDLTDTDDDGWVDIVDNCLDVRNDSQLDSDGDGVGDLCDNCPQAQNPSQLNTDGDFYGDACQPPVVLLTPTLDTLDPQWDVSIECNSALVAQLNLGIVLNNAVPHADYQCGGGCDEPALLGGDGCSAGEASMIGTTVDAATSGCYYSASPPSGVRDDTLYMVLHGNAYESNAHLCEPGSTEYLMTVNVDPAPVGLGDYPHLALAVDGLIELDPTLSSLMLDSLGEKIVPSKMYNQQLAGDPHSLQIELKAVAGTPDRYQVCMKADRLMHRIAFSLEPPLETNGDTATLTWQGCDGEPDEDGLYECLGITSQWVDELRSFAMIPSPGYVAGTNLSSDHLYMVLEGKTWQPPPWSASLHVSTGMDAADPETCLGSVVVGGVTADPPILDAPLALIDLPIVGLPLDPFVGSDNLALQHAVVSVVEFGLDDYDADGISDETDNCTYKVNPTQEDAGGLLTTTPLTDAYGDVCECGESEGNGHILSGDLDLERLRELLTGAVVDPAATDRCSVDGDEACTLLDAITLDRAINASESLTPSCDAANGS